jgi:hypothetical protein
LLSVRAPGPGGAEARYRNGCAKAVLLLQIIELKEFNGDFWRAGEKATVALCDSG